jgi:hypothetical protein
MKWLRRKKRVSDITPRSREAMNAVLEAEHRFTETKARWPEIQTLTKHLAQIRKRNHLAEAIEAAVLGGKDQ